MEIICDCGKHISNVKEMDNDSLEFFGSFIDKVDNAKIAKCQFCPKKYIIIINEYKEI